MTDTDGNPLAGANLDVWQADASGAYSGFMPGPPEGNLRGQVRTRDDGRCEFRTVIPGPARSRCEVVQTLRLKRPATKCNLAQRSRS